MNSQSLAEKIQPKLFLADPSFSWLFLAPGFRQNPLRQTHDRIFSAKSQRGSPWLFWLLMLSMPTMEENQKGWQALK